jgi:hypothetical protein
MSCVSAQKLPFCVVETEREMAEKGVLVLDPSKAPKDGFNSAGGTES